MKRGVNLTPAVIAVYGITFCFIQYSKPVSNVRARRAMKSVGGKTMLRKGKMLSLFLLFTLLIAWVPTGVQARHQAGIWHGAMNLMGIL